jgi:hypothetical protein
MVAFYFSACLSEPSSKNKSSSLVMDSIIAEDYKSPPYRMGFLNADLEKSIPAKYDEARHFSEGRSAINVNGVWGFINIEGEMTIPIQYLGAWSFSAGMAKVQSAQTRKLGFINTQGDTLIPLEYDQAQSASFGLAPVQKGQYWGALNKKNQPVIPFEYYGIKLLSPRYVGLQVTKYWTIFDLKNQTSIAENLQSVYTLTNDVFRVKNETGQYQFLDTLGRALFSEGVDLAYDPQDGVFVRCRKDSGCYLFDDDGNILSNNYERLRPLEMGRFAYYKDGKWGLIDEVGAQLLPAQLDQVYTFSEGYAPYQKDDLWGFINRQGTIAAPHIYGLAWPFENGKARVLTRRGMAFLDRDMNIYPISPDISEVRSFEEGLAAFKQSRD